MCLLEMMMLIISSSVIAWDCTIINVLKYGIYKTLVPQKSSCQQSRELLQNDRCILEAYNLTEFIEEPLSLCKLVQVCASCFPDP